MFVCVALQYCHLGFLFFVVSRYLCLAEFAVGVLLQRLQLLVLLLGFLQLVLHVCILTGTLLQLQKQNTEAHLFLPINQN